MSATAAGAASRSADRLAAWLSLALAPGVGPRTFSRLSAHFGGPESVVAASADGLRAAGLKADSIAAIKSPDQTLIGRILAWTEQPGAEILMIGEPDYPPALAELDDAPPLLYVRGDPAVLLEPQIAIVGTRNPTPGGEQVSAAFSRELAKLGLVITSGLAVGVDGVAHAAALEVGRTIAVLGTGPDRVYPASHRDLARRIVESGAMVSEFPPGQEPFASNFPRRNRIISALSLGVVVTEAALKSGSLITARCALEQGREVFAVPGSVLNPLARGCHALIRDGAKLVETPDDVLAELAPALRAILASASATRPLVEQAGGGAGLPDEDGGRLRTAMGFDPVSLDELVERTGWTAQRVSATLLLLELNGHVSSLPGGRYCRCGS